MEKLHSKDEKAIIDVLNNYGKTINDGDYESWLALWTSDGLQIPPGAPMRKNKDEITKFNKHLFENVTADFKLLDIIEATAEGNIGITVCKYSFSITHNKSNEKTMVEPDGKALTIYEKQIDGQWKLKYDCFNTNV